MPHVSSEIRRSVRLPRRRYAIYSWHAHVCYEKWKLSRLGKLPTWHTARLSVQAPDIGRLPLV